MTRLKSFMNLRQAWRLTDAPFIFVTKLLIQTFIFFKSPARLRNHNLGLFPNPNLRTIILAQIIDVVFAPVYISINYFLFAERVMSRRIYLLVRYCCRNDYLEFPSFRVPSL